MRRLVERLEQYETTADAVSMDLRLDLADAIIRALRERGGTQQQLAEAAGMKPSFISRLVHSNANCTFEVAARVLHALGLRATLTTRRVDGAVDGRPTFTTTATTSAGVPEIVHVQTPVSTSVFGTAQPRITLHQAGRPRAAPGARGSERQIPLG
jgi:transcriptional regulator with XRE-family HTH domain